MKGFTQEFWGKKVKAKLSRASMATSVSCPQFWGLLGSFSLSLGDSLPNAACSLLETLIQGFPILFPAPEGNAGH